MNARTIPENIPVTKHAAPNMPAMELFSEGTDLIEENRRTLISICLYFNDNKRNTHFPQYIIASELK